MEIVDVLEHFDQHVDYDRAEKCEDKLQGAETCPECLQQRYFTGKEVEYSCDQLRKIYALRYLPVHLKENLDILEKVADRNPSLDCGDTVKVLALGGGPGSEIAALQMFIRDNGFFGHDVNTVVVTRVDRVAEWREVSLVVRKIAEDAETKYDYRKVEGDVCDIRALKGGYDLVFLSYLVSELSNAKALELADILKTKLAPKAVIIFNDRNEDAVTDRIASMVGKFSVVLSCVSTKESWVGISYPEKIKERVSPKLTLTSYRQGVVVEV